MKFESPYEWGDIVYLKTDPDQLPRMIMRLSLTPNGRMWILGCGANDSQHYEIEFSKERNVFVACGIAEEKNKA